MIGVLNYLSLQIDFRLEDDLLQAIGIDKPELLDALETLWKEQYLVRTIKDSARHYQFKYNLIKQWWKLNKA